MKKQNFTFFDFCAGIGAGHSSLTGLGGHSVGFSEINPKSEITYRKLHNIPKNKLKNWGDLTKVNTDELPNFDFMIGGFPCQSFSIVGQRKGLKDARGQIIYHLTRILKEKKVKFFLLENVKGLINHEKGNTLKEIVNLLRDSGYRVSWQVLKSSDYGIPQIRERVYFVGIREDLIDGKYDFEFPEPSNKNKPLTEFLISKDASLEFNKNTKNWKTFENYLQNKYNKGLYDLDTLLKEDYLVLDTRQSDLRLFKDTCPTLRTGRHGILYVKNGKLRKLSGKESLLLQGFSLKQTERAVEISETDILSQTGNSFTVNVIEEITKEMISQFPIKNKSTVISIKPKQPAQLNFDLTVKLANGQ